MSSSHVMAWLLKRLPKDEMISLAEIAVAVDVHPKTVEGWIQRGEIDAVDIGSGAKKYWLISRVSLIEFWTRREIGIRAPATSRLPQQQPLFADHETTGESKKGTV